MPPLALIPAFLPPLAVSSGMAPEAHPTASSGNTIVIAACLVILYGLLLAFGYFAPAINEFFESQSQGSKLKHLSWPFAVRSFAGGLAAAYVFILLIPEMEVFNNEIKIPFFNAYSLALLGLMIFKGLQHYCRHLAQARSKTMEEWSFVRSKSHEKHLAFRISGYIFIAYASLIILTLPYQIRHLTGILGVLLYLVTFALHLCFEILSLHEEDNKHYAKFVPFPLAVSLTLALLLAFSNVLPSAFLLACLSLLAGIIIYNVFLVELPDPDRSSYPWFVLGGLMFVLLNSLTVQFMPH